MYLQISLFFFFIPVFDCSCPAVLDDAKFLEAFLVKDDPFKLIAGKTFTAVWTKLNYTKMTACAFTNYLSQPDGTILKNARYTHETGIEVVTGTEVMKKTDKKGIFSVSGTYKDTQKKYSGRMYIFHADENSLGYYVCEEKGVNWNMAVQVKTERKARIISSPNALPSMINAMLSVDFIFSLPGIWLSKKELYTYDVASC